MFISPPVFIHMSGLTYHTLKSSDMVPENLLLPTDCVLFQKFKVWSSLRNLFSQHVAQSPFLPLDNDPDLSDSQSHTSQTSQSDSEIDQGHESTHSTSSGNISTVERLFANLGPYPQPSASAATVTIDTLFASAMDKKVVEDSAPASPSPSTTAGTGISLLDIIFYPLLYRLPSNTRLVLYILLNPLRNPLRQPLLHRYSIRM
jgi:hypothetical protein